MATKILIRRGNEAEWTTDNPILDNGELGYDETNHVLKVGDGLTTWANLPALVGAFQGGPTPPPVDIPVQSVAGRTGAIVLTSSDLEDVTSFGQQLLSKPDAGATRVALGVTSLVGNTVTITGATATRTDPSTGVALPLPPTCTVLWISSTSPTNMLAQDFWINDPNL